jgi:hypothetical protein
MNIKSEESRSRHRLKDVPQWFLLKNYQGATDLDAAGWYAQIGIRLLCFGLLREMRSPDPIFPEWNDPVQEALSRMRENPICDLNSSPFDHVAFSYFRSIEPLEVPVVRSMTLKDLYRIDSRVRRNLTQAQIDEAQEIANDRRLGIHFRFEHPNWMQATVDEECFGTRQMPLVIDLNFPNYILKEHFETHLQKLRRHREGKREEAGKHSPDLREWAKIGILPSMDLLIWEEEAGGRIPDGRLADALSADCVLDEERVRRTIRPLAMGLLEQSVEGSIALSRIRARAYSDRIQRQLVHDRKSTRKNSN